MVTGRGGMGSHKHGVSGRVPTNKSNAMRRARELNMEIKKREEAKKLRRGNYVDSVSKLFRKA